MNWKRKIKNEKKIGAACAVEIAQIVSRRFFEGVKVGEIEIGSEDIAMEEINRTRTKYLIYSSFMNRGLRWERERFPLDHL